MLIQRFPLLLHYIIININLFTFTWDTITLLIASLIIHSFYILPPCIFDSFRFQSKGQFSAILVMKLEYVYLRPFFKAKCIACIYCIFATKNEKHVLHVLSKKTCGNANRWYKKSPLHPALHKRHFKKLISRF